MQKDNTWTVFLQLTLDNADTVWYPRRTQQGEIGMTHDFDYVWNMVSDLRTTSSTIEKQGIIEDYCNQTNASATFAKQILKYTYHPLWQYNVTSDNLQKKSHLRGKEYKHLFVMLDDLKSRKITGHDAIGSVNTFIDSYPEHEELIHCIIDKDLKTRAGDKIINKAIPNHIPEFSVALADKYEPKLVDWKDSWFVSRKLDGLRLIAVVDENGNSTFFSRTGKVFDTLDIISGGIKALGITNVVFDGELCLVDDDGNEDFQGIMKEIRKKDHTIPNPSYKIFDMITHDEFYSKKGSKNRPYSIRYANLCAVMQPNECSCLSVLEQEVIKNDEHFCRCMDKAKEYGWEGLMLRADEPYKGKRSKDLLKFKSFFDDEYEVVDVEMGPFRYVKDSAEHEETMLSCVMIQHKDYIVRVGSGFTIEQRQEFYKNPKKILGKIITVQYFEETKNQEGGISLRFPTFKILHGSARTV
jgi:DNA ligase-1